VFPPFFAGFWCPVIIYASLPATDKQCPAVQVPCALNLCQSFKESMEQQDPVATVASLLGHVVQVRVMRCD